MPPKIEVNYSVIEAEISRMKVLVSECEEVRFELEIETVGSTGDQMKALYGHYSSMNKMFIQLLNKTITLLQNTMKEFKEADKLCAQKMTAGGVRK